MFIYMKLILSLLQDELSCTCWPIDRSTMYMHDSVLLPCKLVNP